MNKEKALKIWKSENVDASKIPIKYWNDKSCINEAIVQIFLKIQKKYFVKNPQKARYASLYLE